MSHDTIRDVLEAVLGEMGVEGADIRLERPRDPSHGDVATNVAMTLASRLSRAPRQIAEEIAAKVPVGEGGITAVEVAGPGFLNFRLSADEVGSLLRDILAADEAFGRHDVGADRPIMVEFVSANPTGPLHLGHGRQAALGDAISSLLEWTGWRVYREYYYNDSGAQIDRLSTSVLARYREALGLESAIPEGGYHGEYVRELADELVEAEGDRFRDADPSEPIEEIRRFAVERLRAEQNEDLDGIGVHFDEFFLESSLYETRRVDDTAERLRETGLVYEKDGAVWLKTTEFGDQKDRVMIRSDGNPTYFLPDVAYHMTKWERGFHHAINVQGADHHGTVDRVRAGLQALGLPEGYPEYVLHQMVTVEKEGEEVKFSKRAGSYVTLRDLTERVGSDVVRYFFQMRKPDGHLVFDLDMALDQSEKNPVYKIQYAHARMCSIFRKAELSIDDAGVGEDADTARLDLSLLVAPVERELMKRLSEFPDQVARAAELRAPHLVCDYLEQMAGAVNSWYHAGNPSRNPELAVLVDDPDLRAARLALTKGIRIVLRNGLQLLGISAPERMVRDETEE